MDRWLWAAMDFSITGRDYRTIVLKNPESDKGVASKLVRNSQISERKMLRSAS
jgi:hypothetical protein